MHFAFEDNYYHLYIGNIQGEISSARPGDFVAWVDNTRYLYGDSLGKIDKEEYVKVTELPLDITSASFIILGH